MTLINNLYLYTLCKILKLTQCLIIKIFKTCIVDLEFLIRMIVIMVIQRQISGCKSNLLLPLM